MPAPKRASLIFNPVKVDVALRKAVDSVASAATWPERLRFGTTFEDVEQKVTKEEHVSPLGDKPRGKGAPQ